MKIHIPNKVHQKIMYWVNKASFEVSGFGKCVVVDGNVVVIDCHLLKQEGGAAHTDIDATALSKLMFELKDTPGELRFWWHSHVNMPTFMSSQDKETLNELGEAGWAVAAVFNKKAEITGAFSYHYTDPLGTLMVYFDDKIPVEVGHLLQASEIAELDTVYDINVTEKKGYNSISNVLAYDANGVLKDPLGYLQTHGSASEGDVEDYMDKFSELEEAKALGMTVKAWRKAKRTYNATQLNEAYEKIDRALDEKYGSSYYGSTHV